MPSWVVLRQHYSVSTIAMGQPRCDLFTPIGGGFVLSLRFLAKCDGSAHMSRSSIDGSLVTLLSVPLLLVLSTPSSDTSPLLV